MPKQYQWEPCGPEGEKLVMQALRLYVQPGEGGFRYHIGGHFLLRHSIKPVPTIEAAKAKCLKVAAEVLRSELSALNNVKSATAPAVSGSSSGR